MAELTVEKITLEISNFNDVVVLEVSSVVSGGSGANIDDSAGLGVIDKTWSANKIKTEISKTQDTLNTLESKVDINTATILNKVDKEVGKGLSSNDFSDVDKVKLEGVATGATANAEDSFLLDRDNHTGVQPIESVDGLQLTIEVLESDVSTLSTEKVDKVEGKGLSDENFTKTEKTKLSSVGDTTRDFLNDYLLKRG